MAYTEPMWEFGSPAATQRLRCKPVPGEKGRTRDNTVPPVNRLLRQHEHGRGKAQIVETPKQLNHIMWVAGRSEELAVAT